MVRRVLLAAAFLVAAARIADACSCQEMPPCQRYWTGDAVFTGVVIGVTLSGDQTHRLSHTVMVIDRGFRGASGQVILTDNANSTCHYSFVVGERYLVYATRGADGTLTTGVCSGNKRLAAAQADLDYAERLPAPGSGGRIFGRVRRFDTDVLDRRNSREIYPAGAAITIRDSSGTALELRTDSEGKFEAAGLKADWYSISTDAPATALVSAFPNAFALRDRACVPVSITYQPNGRIAGRIVDVGGLAVAGAWVSTVPRQFTTKREFPDVSIQSNRTDADGRYEIGPLPPGEYQVGVNVERAPTLDSPFPTTYSPGVPARAQAETIALAEGERHLADIALPERLRQVSVSGTVVFADGTPAQNARVSLVAGSVSGISMARTDSSGSFTLRGLGGSTYTVRASFYASAGNHGSAEATVSLAEESVAGLTLVLKK